MCLIDTMATGTVFLREEIFKNMRRQPNEIFEIVMFFPFSAISQFLPSGLIFMSKVLQQT